LETHAEGFGTRIAIEGEDIVLKPEAVHNLGLALHELAVNAEKYGSLSDPKGGIRINWGFCDEAKTLKLVWQETGGPKVSTPERSGTKVYNWSQRRPLASAALATAAGAQERDFEWSGRLDSGQELTIRGISGDVVAHLASGSEARVEARKTGRSSDFDRVEVVMTESRDQLVFCVIYDGRRGESDCDSRYDDNDRHGGRNIRSGDLRRLARVLGAMLLRGGPRRAWFSLRLLGGTLRRRPSVFKEAVSFALVHMAFYDYTRRLTAQLDASMREIRSLEMPAKATRSPASDSANPVQPAENK